MMTVSLGELECIGDDALIVKYDTCTKNGFVNRIEFAVQRSGIDFLLAELRMGQLGCQVTVVGQQQHTGGVAIETADRINTLSAGIANNVNHRFTLFGIVGRSDGVLGLVEQDIYFPFAANRLIVESYLIGRQHFRAE